MLSNPEIRAIIFYNLLYCVAKEVIRVFLQLVKEDFYFFLYQYP